MELCEKCRSLSSEPGVACLCPILAVVDRIGHLHVRESDDPVTGIQTPLGSSAARYVADGWSFVEAVLARGRSVHLLEEGERLSYIAIRENPKCVECREANERISKEIGPIDAQA